MSRVARARWQLGCACAAAAVAGLALAGCSEDRHSDDGRLAAGAPAAPVDPPDGGSTDASFGAQAGMRAPAPLDGGRPFGMRPDVVFGVRRPTAPRSRATIVGRVLDLTGAPLRDAAASAGGAAVSSDSGGYVVIDEVYGEREADVFVGAFGHSRGHVRVPIREDETSYVVVVLAPTTSVEIADVAVAADRRAPDAGAAVTVAAFALHTAAESFVTPWRETATGPATLRYAAPVARADIAAAPGGLLAIGENGARERLRARALFEVRVEQVGMQLALIKPAQVQVQLWAEPVGGADAGTPAAAADRLYWFDEAEGAFVARGEIDAGDGAMARGEIDRLGYWAVGQIDASERTSCQRLRVQDSAGAPLPFAAVHVTSTERFDSAQLVAGADGTVCWQAAPAEVARVLVFGASAAGLHSADSVVGGEPGVAAGPGACGDVTDSCAQLAPVAAEALAQTCVRGELSLRAGLDATVQWLASSAADEILAGGALDRPGAFCLAVPRGAEVAFSASGANCTASLPPAPAPEQAGICGASDCLDLGTVECCSVYDLCDGAGGDEDCDGASDEGCTCGTATCIEFRSDACCTSAQACGARAVVSHECLPLEQPGRDEPACPTETLMLSSTETYQSTGCCRPDGECGLQSGWGCIARVEASDIWPIEAPLASIACTY